MDATAVGSKHDAFPIPSTLWKPSLVPSPSHSRASRLLARTSRAEPGARARCDGRRAPASRPTHASPLRADDVAGDEEARTRRSGEAAGGVQVLNGTVAEEGAGGWSAVDRDELVGLAPDGSKKPYYVSPATAGTEDS